MNNDILTPEQIKNWRNIICLHIEKVAEERGMPEGAGVYAFYMPENEVIQYYKSVKQILETPELKAKSQVKPVYKKEPCKHTNSFIGQMGKYCIDCEKYV